MMGGARLWAKSIGRRRWAATMFLVLFAGLSGGAVMTAMGAARRMSSALDRYLGQPELATKTVFGCPVGLTEKDIEADPGTICSGTKNVSEVARLLRGSPFVTRVQPIAVLLVGLKVPGSPRWDPSIQYALLGGSELIGAPVVVAGREPRPDAPREIVINEALARRDAITVGDTIELGSYRAEQRLALSSNRVNVEPLGSRVSAEVVGLIRTSDDLLTDPEAVVYTNAAWWSAYGSDDLAGYGKSSLVHLRDKTKGRQFEQSLRSLLPRRVLQVQDALSPTESSQRVIELQSAAAWAVAIAGAIASTGFFVQAIGRQCGRDLADRLTLTALGMARRDLLVAVVLRTLPVAVGAGLVSAGVAVLASPVGPIGLARRIEIAPGMRFDATVVLGGAFAVVLITIVASLGAATLRLRRADRDAPRPFVRAATRIPVTVRAGLSFLRRGERTALPGALIGTAVAVGFVVIAAGASASHLDLVAHPDRFGQSWQVTAGDFGSAEEIVAGAKRLARVTGIEEYGQTRSTVGSSIDGRRVFVFSFTRQGVAVGPTIGEGRAPRIGEVALGARTLRVHHLALGDRVSIRSPGGRSVGPLTIVGRVVVNDGLTDQRPDDGALVSNDTFDMIDVPSVAQSFLIRASPGVRTDELIARLRTGFGTSVKPAKIPEDIANLERVAAAPTLLAALVAALAAAAMANTLLTVLTRRRRDIGVLRAIGFSRIQVVGATAAMALALMVPAVLLGVLFGVIATRWGWSVVQSRLGIESIAVLPLGAVVVAVLGTLAIAQVVALIPGLHASRVRPAAALAAE